MSFTVKSSGPDARAMSDTAAARASGIFTECSCSADSSNPSGSFGGGRNRTLHQCRGDESSRRHATEIFPACPVTVRAPCISLPDLLPDSSGSVHHSQGINMLVRGISVAIASLLATSVASAQTVYPTGTTIWDHAKTFDGYTIFLGADGTAYMIDMDGSVVNTWTSPAPGFELNTVEPLEHGHIMAFIQPVNTNGPNRSVGELDFNSAVTWHFDIPTNAPASASFHHDSERLASGNSLMLGLQKILVT